MNKNIDDLQNFEEIQLLKKQRLPTYIDHLIPLNYALNIFALSYWKKDCCILFKCIYSALLLISFYLPISWKCSREENVAPGHCSQKISIECEFKFQESSKIDFSFVNTNTISMQMRRYIDPMLREKSTCTTYRRESSLE